MIGPYADYAPRKPETWVQARIPGVLIGGTHSVVVEWSDRKYRYTADGRLWRLVSR